MKNILFFVLFLFIASSFAPVHKYKLITERNGMIGIGTKTPDAMLTVKGHIHTQEVLVDLKGAVAPDYVFDTYYEGHSHLQPDYKFPKLEDVGAFVEANHHLPGIPSAKSLSQDGISLKEMNLKLLQKIEELTLYTLEQQDQIDQLKEALKK